MRLIAPENSGQLDGNRRANARRSQKRPSAFASWSHKRVPFTLPCRCMFLAMSSESYHEPIELLSEDTKNTHRAIVSLKEELEAIDWYQQRAEACSNDELRAVLLHNKNEEIEHAMMTLEWLRRNNSNFSQHIDTYIKSSGPITEVEKNATGGGSEKSASASTGSSPSLGIGSLKGMK
jgi:ferritin-like protein